MTATSESAFGPAVAPVELSGGIGLRTMVMAGAIIIALVPAAVLGIGSTIGIRRLVFADAAQQTAIIARVFASQIDQFLTAQRQDVSQIATDAARQPAFDKDHLQPLLSAAIVHQTDLVSVFVTDAHGISVARADTEGNTKAGTDYSDRAYWKEAVATRRVVTGKDVITGRAVRVPIVAIAAPIIDAAGQLKGVAVGGIAVATIMDLANDIHIGSSGRATIATGAGQLVVSGNRANTPGEDVSKRPVWRQMSQARGGELHLYQGNEGEQRVGGFATVPDVGWKVWVTRSAQEIERNIVESYRGTVWWVVVTLLVVIVLAVLFARLISRPVEALQATAARIAEGQLDQQSLERGPRELLGLSRAFNYMARSLRRVLDGEREGKARLQQAVADYGTIAARVAGGDLTARAPASEIAEMDQLGTGINRMIESLAQLISEIQEAASNTTASASQILAATTEQVAATAEEATAVRQTGVTVTEVRQTADLAMQKAKAVVDAAEKGARIAQDGQRAVGDSIRSSEESKQRMENLAERILALSEQAHAIAEINATVNQLAEQSNLLAVNASIEAAKAGEAGKGFAVVATEVRGLAEQSKQATTQVRGILMEIQRATQAAVVAAEQGVKSAEAVTETAGKSGEAIRALAANVTETGQAAQQILATSQQQTVGMDQVTLAMRNIEQSSSQTVSATQQVESAVRNMNALAKRLTELVGGFAAARSAPG